MITITNVSRVIDNSGATPIEISSNPVQTTIAENPVPTETRYQYDLSRTAYPSRCAENCCPCCDVCNCACGCPCWLMNGCCF